MLAGRYSSPCGEITIMSNENAITGLWIEGQSIDKKYLKRLILKI